MAGTLEQVSYSTDALMKEFYIITHNLANVSTAGYKRVCNAFSRALQSQAGVPDAYYPGEIDLDSAFDFSQGSLTQTGRPLDLALHGKGFFVIETLQGPLYTRNGMFQTNPNGQIVDPDGRIVAGEGGPITVPPDVSHSQITVSGDGTLSTADTTIGKFRIVEFGDDESKLIPAGGNCFHMPDEDVMPVTAGNAVVKQGYQEASNVRIVDELVDMIMVARLYEANMKIVSAQQEASSSIMGVAAG